MNRMKANQLRNSILDILLRIEKDNSFSHLLIDHEIKSGRISPRDEGLMTEIVYGTIQRKITLDYYIEGFLAKGKKVEPWVRILLRMSLYQMIYLDKVPDHAIIHEAVEIAKQRGHKGISSLVNGVLRSVQRKGVPPVSNIADPEERLSVETSHPLWLVKRWVKLYGFETAKKICETNLIHKPVSVRVQPLKISRGKAMEILEEQGFEVRPSVFSSQGIIVDKGNILRTDLFRDGFVTIQDQSSMLVAEMLKAERDMVVLDACSAPGGKATHIAEKMEDRGRIQSYDLHKKKAEQIEHKAKQLDLHIIDANHGDARKLAEKHQPETFDRILVDAPCSGLGVIRGKPEIKYHKKEADIERLAEIQFDILASVAPLLKKEGLLVYSTCTVDKGENESVVKQFLANHPDFTIDPDFFNELPEDLAKAEGITEYGFQLFPQSFNTDGFFLVRFKKNG